MSEKLYYAKGDEYDGYVYCGEELIAETVGTEWTKNIANTLNELHEENMKLKQALSDDIIRRCEAKEAFKERFGEVW